MLKALEIYRELTIQNPDRIDTCSPHTLRMLVYTVLSESRAINLNSKCVYDEKSSSPVKEICHRKSFPISSGRLLSVYEVRKIR